MKLSLLTICVSGKNLKIGTALAAVSLSFGCAAVPSTGGPGQGAVGAVPTTAVPTTAVPTTPGVPPLTNLGPVTETTHDADAGITVGPPHGTGAVVDWSTIGKTCATGESLCAPSLTGFVQLGNATSPQAGTMRSDGTVDSLMNDRRVYILEFRGMPCAPVGPNRHSPSSSPSPSLTISPTGPTQDESCEVKNYIDAQSGDILYTVSYPKPGVAQP